MLRSFADLLVLRIIRKFSIHAESSDSSEAITIRVEEFFCEKIFRLFSLRWISWSQSCIEAKQCCFVFRCFSEEVQLFFGKCVQDQRIARIADRTNRLERACLNDADLVAECNTDLAEFFACVLIDDQFSGIVLWLEFLNSNIFDFIEQFKNLFRTRELLIHRTKEGGCGQLCRLVDAHRQDVLLCDFQFDP